MLPFCSLEGGASHVASIVCDVDAEHWSTSGLADGTVFHTCHKCQNNRLVGAGFIHDYRHVSLVELYRVARVEQVVFEMMGNPFKSIYNATLVVD